VIREGHRIHAVGKSRQKACRREDKRADPTGRRLMGRKERVGCFGGKVGHLGELDARDERQRRLGRSGRTGGKERTGFVRMWARYVR